jgi:hypothetical protein
MLQNEKLAEEDSIQIQKKLEQKIKLKEIQERDKLQKQENRSKDYTLPAKSQDFAQTNILSYIYETKDHKAYEYRKRNDAIQNLMKDQFSSTQFQPKRDEDKAILRHEQENNLKIDTDIKKRYQDRKAKELEAKLFLDKQIAEKSYIKTLQLKDK